MPVSFLSAIQRENYGRYAGSPTSDELTRFFHLTDDDRAQIMTGGQATRVAFVHCLEATAQDDVLEVLEGLLHEVCGEAEKADKKAKLRTIKDLDQAAMTLAEACRLLLDPAMPDAGLREKLFEKIPRAVLEGALENVTALTRPPDTVYYLALAQRHRAVKGYLPSVLKHIRFEAGPAGKPVVAAYDWLRDNLHRRKSAHDAPREIIGKAWQRYVVRQDNSLDLRAYTFCVLDQLETALRRRCCSGPSTGSAERAYVRR